MHLVRRSDTDAAACSRRQFDLKVHLDRDLNYDRARGESAGAPYRGGHNLQAVRRRFVQHPLKAQQWILTDARAAEEAGEKPDGFSLTSDKLPPRLMHPSFWAPFVLSGDWR